MEELNLLKRLGERIKQARQIQKLTQADIAEELNMTSSAFSKIELGTNNTPIKRLFQIAQVLEVEIVEFFESNLIIAENNEKFGYATKSDFEGLKCTLESFMKNMEERLPPNPVHKTYKARSKKSDKK